MKKKLALFMAVLMVSLIVPIESLAISNMGEKDLPAKIAVVTLMDDSDANLDSIGVQPLNYDQATYSYVLNNEADKDTAQLILSLPNEEGSLDISAEGDVEYLELSETITIIRGYLYGDFEVDSTPYIIKAVFTKRVGVDGASAGITIHPKDNVDQSVFFSIGEDLYTDEVIAVDPLFNLSKSESTPYATSSLEIPSAYEYVGGDYANIHANSLGITGRAQTVDAYFKQYGVSIPGGTRANLFAVIITPELDSLNSSYKNTVILRSVDILLESQDTAYAFDRFFHNPVEVEVYEFDTLYDILGDLFTYYNVQLQNTIFNILKMVPPDRYTATISGPSNDKVEYGFVVTGSNALYMEFPIILDLKLDVADEGYFRIDVTANMEFSVINYQDQHQFYLVDANEVYFSTDRLHVY